MQRLSNILGILATLHSLVLVVRGSPITCSSSNVRCSVEVEDHNLLDVTSVSSLSQCRALCEDLEECEFYTWYSQEDPVTANLCYLFSSCQTVSSCQHCVTERTGSCYCGAHVTGSLSASLDMIPYTPTELACSRLCQNHSECQFYTWQSKDLICFLQSDLSGSLQPCTDCLTGPADCTEFSLCKIYVGQQEGEAFKFEYTDTEEMVTVVGLGQAPCEVRVLGVGGGGPGYSQLNDGGYSGGGGSGNIFYSTFLISSEAVSLNVSVGGEHQASTVLADKGGLTSRMVARPGSLGQDHYGGSGYSGGGHGPFNNGQFSGGQDGSDGEGENRGRGSGLDISLFEFRHFQVTAGSGGGQNQRGGGGGGVLVDQEGPLGEGGQGQGYGAGGEGAYTAPPHQDNKGLPGVVILEVL